MKIELKFIFEKSCLFINQKDDIFMFFYVNDIVFAYKSNREQNVQNYVDQIKRMFEIRDMRSLKFFLEMRIIQSIDFVYLVQDAYIDTLVKNYQININVKASSISLSLSENDLQSYQKDIDSKKIHTYRQKVESVCHSVIIISSDIIKSAFKLIEYLINLESEYMTAVDHCIRYLYKTKHLKIKFDVLRDEELTNFENKHVFETSIDASFVNEENRLSIENYTFKLFDDLID